MSLLCDDAVTVLSGWQARWRGTVVLYKYHVIPCLINFTYLSLQLSCIPTSRLFWLRDPTQFYPMHPFLYFGAPALPNQSPTWTSAWAVPMTRLAQFPHISSWSAYGRWTVSGCYLSGGWSLNWRASMTELECMYRQVYFGLLWRPVHIWEHHYYTPVGLYVWAWTLCDPMSVIPLYNSICVFLHIDQIRLI